MSVYYWPARNLVLSGGFDSTTYALHLHHLRYHLLLYLLHHTSHHQLTLTACAATVLVWKVSDRRCLEEIKGHHKDAIRSVLAVRDDTTGKEALWTAGDDKDAAFCVYDLV